MLMKFSDGQSEFSCVFNFTIMLLMKFAKIRCTQKIGVYSTD